MTTAQIIIVITIVAYLFAMLMIGVIFSRKGAADTSNSFYIGGRSLGPLVTAMSAEASDMSSYLLMGLPGLAYIAGVAEVGWTVIGLAVGTYLNFLLVSRRLRRYSAKLNAFTVPEYFSNRYGDKKHAISLIAALIILVFFVPYTASGFKAVGTLFNSLFGIDYHLAMLFGAVIIISYTTLGGFMAVSTTDLIQSLFMSIALVIVVFFGIGQAGGMAQVAANAKELPGYLNLFQGYNMADNTAGSYGFLPIVSTLAWGLGYFGMPHILLRFMAIRDEKELTISRRIASVWVVISMAVAIFIGIIGYSISKAGKIDMLTTSAESETIIIKIAGLMAEHGVILALVAGIILAGILAATMSTADSQLLAASSSVSQDITQDFLGIDLSQRMGMILARGTVIVIAIIGIILAWNPNSSVFRVVSFAWAGFGATFGPVMLLSLFWKRSNRQGAFAGLLVGGVMVFVWKFLIAPLGGAFAIYELLPAFILALVADVVVSLLTPAPEQEILDVYEEVMKN
ncbi:MAG: sodium/proline symporter [Lachnospiraceae bacterium]|nr:sodium/proline symporter [Lachnospiraceae bacterium]